MSDVVRREAPSPRLLVGLALVVHVCLVYVVIVLMGGVLVGSPTPSLPLAVLATAVVALSVEPLRNGLRRRLRATPYDQLSGFTSQIFAAVETDDLAPRMAQLLADGTSARSVEVWLMPHGSLAGRQLAARWPVDGDPLDVPAADGSVHVHDVVHEEVLLGRIVRETTGTQLAPLEQRLLDDVLASAGIALRSLALTTGLRQTIDEIRAETAELRRSRERIVVAQDRARRRLERDIHDGAQQHLVALAVNLGRATTVAARDPARAAGLIEELRTSAVEALAALEDLSRGIYPRVLTDCGPAAALRAVSATSPVPVQIVDQTARRLPASIEAAIYFGCLEALQNAVKHAHPAGIRVSLREVDGELWADVSDDGCGFDPAASADGSGLRGLRDRVESLGGVLTVASRIGQGTHVSSRIPVPAPGSDRGPDD